MSTSTTRSYPTRRIWILTTLSVFLSCVIILHTPLSPLPDFRLTDLQLQDVHMFGYGFGGAGKGESRERKEWTREKKLCSVRDVVEGEWRVKKPLESMDELYERYHFSNHSVTSCAPVGVTPTISEDGNKHYPPELVHQRVLAMASPELVPRSNLELEEGQEDGMCVVAELDPREMVKRLLRSRVGLVLVGDSLTQQHTRQLINLFSLHPYVKLIEHSHTMPRWEFSLDLTHPSSASIISEAGISQSRAEQPFIIFWRHHHLLTREESDSIFGDLSEHYKLTEEPIGDDWFVEMGEKVFQGEFIEKEGVKEEPSVIVLNTGPHWNGGEFGGLSHDEWEEGFARMVETVDHKLKHAPYPISTYFRPTLPGQIDCADISQLDNERTDLISPFDPKKPVHNYLSFSWMNEIMSAGRALSHDSSEYERYFSELGATGIPPPNPPSIFFDAWEMSVKRPEAHRSPPVDCLHWCQVGVPDHWTKLMWHMMVLESQNIDYI